MKFWGAQSDRDWEDAVHRYDESLEHEDAHMDSQFQSDQQASATTGLVRSRLTKLSYRQADACGCVVELVPCATHQLDEVSSEAAALRLLAAADLYAALKGLLKYRNCCCEFERGNPMMGAHSPQCEAARDAIAKAEGREP